MSEIVANIIRDGTLESIHRGDLVVIDIEGNIVFSLGDPYKLTFWRSAAKPFQVLPMIEAGGIEYFGFTGHEIALMTSSHNGEEEHVATLQKIFSKLNINTYELQCGTAPPMSKRAAIKLMQKGESFTTLTNPCSGKHACMLALCILKDYSLKNYYLPEHPVQQNMLQAVSYYTNLSQKDITLGTDGCGVPVFGLPLYNMARAYAILSNSDAESTSLQKVSSAMTSYPYYVAGTKRLDTMLMEVTKGRILAKLGAEGVYCLSVIDKKLGLALKIEDGNFRAIDPIIIEVLNRLGCLSNHELEKLSDKREVALKNHRKEFIGIIKAAF